MVNCDVICDLMEIYHSGEASPATRQLVEEHLEECKDCLEKYNKGSQAEQVLSQLSQTEMPTNGTTFIARLKRLVFGFGTGILLLFTITLVLISRVLFVDFLDLPLLELVIDLPLWLGAAALAGYGGALYYSKSSTNSVLKPWLTAARILTLLLFSAVGLTMIKEWGMWANVLVNGIFLGLYITLTIWRINHPEASASTEKWLIIEIYQ